MIKAMHKVLGITLALAAPLALAEVNIGKEKHIRFGTGSGKAINWSSLHSNAISNTYQETLKVVPVCVNGRSFVAVLGMAGVWDKTSAAGAGAGGGAGIVQVFDSGPDGNMQAAECED